MPQVVVAVVSFIGTVGAATVAAVAGAGALSAISVGAMFAIGAGVIAGGLMLANKLISSLYEMPKMDTDASRQRTVKGTIEPQKILYGQNLVSGPISFVGTYGDTNRVLAHAVVLAGHEVEEIVDIYFDDEVITDSQIDANGYVTSGTFGPKGNKSFTFGVTNFGTNICKINRYTGASGQTADPDLVSNFFSYTSDHVGTGLAYITTHWLLKDGSQKTWDQYSPQNIKAIVKGRKVYDPRTTLTAYSDNPALCLADYLTNTDFGMGIASAKIDWDSVEAAANACDVTVSVPSGTEKRFACNGVLFGTDSHKTNINKILSSMNGLLSFTNGKYVIRAGVYEAPTVNLDEDNLIGAVSIKTSFERSDRFNTVTGTFIDPAQNYKATEFPEVQLTAALLRDNGEVLSKDIQLPMTNSSYMAQRIAHKLVQISDQQKVVTFPTNLAGMQIAIGDRVSVSLEEFNWSNKVFICLGWTFSDSGNGGVNLILREDDSGSYADPTVGEYSTISATGGIITGFKGFPDPQNLTATAGLKSIELNWDNPDNMSDIEQIEVFASPNSNWASAVKIGSVSGTQFTHDESNAVDSVAIGDTRYYWVRARGYSVGDSAEEVSDRNPDNDTSTISATAGSIPWNDVSGDAKPEDNATVGATVGTDLYDDDGATVLTHDDIANAVLRLDLSNVQIETGEVLDLETGQDVLIQNLGDVAIYVNESNQIINSNISAVSNAVSGLEATIVDLVSGVSDVYVQPTPPVAGVGGIPDPIPTFSRWYDSDDSNAPYYWNDTEWVSLADPRIASNAASITTLQSGLNTANTNISANSSAIDVLDTTTIAQGNSITSLSSDVTTLQTDLTAAEGNITTNSTAISSLTTRVTAAEGTIVTNSTDISSLETNVTNLQTNTTANATAISGLDTRVTQTEADITASASDITALETTVNDATTGVLANAGAISGLDTRVTSAEGTIDAHTSDITALEVVVNDGTTGVLANASAISSLDSRVTINEGAISSTASDTTALQASFTDLTKIQGEADAVITTEDGTELVLNLPTDVAQATSEATTLLDARVTSAEGTITSQSSAITQLQSDLTTLDGEQTGTATALSALTTRVTTAEGSITVNSTDITALESSLATTDGNVSANSTAISSLDTRVTSAEGSITANSSSITTLESSLTTANTNITANADAITAIDTRVTTAEGNITSQASSITDLQTSLSTAEGNITANADAITAIDVRVTAAEGSIESQSTSITALESDVSTAQTTADGKVTTFYQDEPPTAEADGDLWFDTNDGNKLYRWNAGLATPAWVEVRDSGISGNATAIESLTTRVTATEDSIDSQSTSITELQSSVSTAQTTADGKVATFYQDEAPTAEGDGDLWFDTNDGNKLYRWDASLETPAWVEVRDEGISGNATAIESLDTRVTANENSITSQASSITTLQSDVVTAQTSADSKAQTYYQDDAPTGVNDGDLWFDTNDNNKLYRWDGSLATPAWVSVRDGVTTANATAITSLDTRVTATEGDITSQATAITALETTVGENTTSITQNTTSIDGVKAQYTVTIDNGQVSGFGLVADIIDGEPASAFIVNADQFAVGGAGELGDEYPFVVYTTEQTVSKNGTNYTIPAGIYIKDAFIQNAAIEAAQIQNAAITNAKIKDGEITNAKIGNLQVDTAKIANGAITNRYAVYTDGAVVVDSATYVKVQELSSIDFDGGTVSILFNCSLDDALSNRFDIRLSEESQREYTAGSMIFTQVFSGFASYSFFPQMITLALTIQPAAGTYDIEVYSKRADTAATSLDHIVAQRFLQAIETKK